MLYKPFFGKFGLPSYLVKPIFLKGIRNGYIGKKVRIFPHLQMETHQITNIDHDYQEIGTAVVHQKYLVKETKIGENCFIGMGAAIMAGNILGKQCVVGANSIVRGEFPDYCVIAGSPAKIIKKYNFETQTWE